MTLRLRARGADLRDRLRSGRTGIYDNAAAESFNATIKKELIYQHLWLDAEEARSAVFEYIERYYNRVRKQRRLGN